MNELANMNEEINPSRAAETGINLDVRTCFESVDLSGTAKLIATNIDRALKASGNGGREGDAQPCGSATDSAQLLLPAITLSGEISKSQTAQQRSDNLRNSPIVQTTAGTAIEVIKASTLPTRLALDTLSDLLPPALAAHQGIQKAQVEMMASVISAQRKIVKQGVDSARKVEDELETEIGDAAFKAGQKIEKLVQAARKSEQQSEKQVGDVVSKLVQNSDKLPKEVVGAAGKAEQKIERKVVETATDAAQKVDKAVDAAAKVQQRVETKIADAAVQAGQKAEKLVDEAATVQQKVETKIVDAAVQAGQKAEKLVDEAAKAQQKVEAKIVDAAVQAGQKAEKLIDEAAKARQKAEAKVVDVVDRAGEQVEDKAKELAKTAEKVYEDNPVVSTFVPPLGKLIIDRLRR